MEGCGKTYTHPSSLRKHLKAHESAGELKMEKSDNLSSSGEHSPINNSSHSSNMSDEGNALHRERLPSFERIQDGAASDPYATNSSPHQIPYHYEMSAADHHQAVNMAQVGYSNHVPYVAYPIHPDAQHSDHLEGVSDGQNASPIGTDLNLWSHYNWNAPLTSQLVSPQTY